MTRLLALSLVLLAASASAQRPDAVPFELAGPGGTYFICHERAVAPSVHVRAVVAYHFFVRSIPVTAHWTPDLGLGRFRLESGAGVDLWAGATALYDPIRTNRRQVGVGAPGLVGPVLGS